MTDRECADVNAAGALRLAVLISGTGSNLRALLEAIERERCAARVVAVVSDRASAGGLRLAEDRGIPTRVVPPKAFGDRGQWDTALAETVAGFEPELVVLAGFMRIVGTPLLHRFARRILNVHPSLLPAFPGADGPAQALAAGVRIAGCTVHLVDGGVDSGPIIAQAAVPVLPDDDVPRLHARIQRMEHLLLPAVLDAVARGQVALSPLVRFHTSSPLLDSDALASPAWLKGHRALASDAEAAGTLDHAS